MEIFKRNVEEAVSSCLKSKSNLCIFVHRTQTLSSGRSLSIMKNMNKDIQITRGQQGRSNLGKYETKNKTDNMMFESVLKVSHISFPSCVVGKGRVSTPKEMR